MRSLSLLLLTSSHEGLPMVMLEALSVGVCVTPIDAISSADGACDACH
jgi:glycosyltransferase involved in cell wall biosynthesis